MSVKQKASAKAFMNGLVDQLNTLGFDETTLFQLEEKILLSKSLLDKITVEQCKQADYYGHTVVDYGRTNFQKLKIDVEWLMNYLKDGKTLSGYYFSIYKIFANNALRKRMYVLNNVFVAGKPCDTMTNLKVVHNVLITEITLNRVAELWDSELKPFYSFHEKYQFYSNLLVEGIAVAQNCHLASIALENIKFDLERNIFR